VQGAQRAGHDDEPAAVAQQRGEGPQHAGGAEVVDLGVGAHDRAGVIVGADPHDGVAEHDVDAAVPFTDNHRTFDGIVFPTRRRIYRRNADRTADKSQASITIDLDSVTLA
jgi:hypothetical protein